MDEALVRDVAFRDLDVTHDFPRIGRRTMRLNARRIVDPSTTSTLLLQSKILGCREAAEINTAPGESPRMHRHFRRGIRRSVDVTPTHELSRVA
jgi:hypothetical protein